MCNFIFHNPFGYLSVAESLYLNVSICNALVYYMLGLHSAGILSVFRWLSDLCGIFFLLLMICLSLKYFLCFCLFFSVYWFIGFMYVAGFATIKLCVLNFWRILFSTSELHVYTLFLFVTLTTQRVLFLTWPNVLVCCGFQFGSFLEMLISF